MIYPDEPTIHESINQFFNFVEEFSEKEDFDDEIENWDEAEEGEPHPYLQSLEAFENVKKFIEEAYLKAKKTKALRRKKGDGKYLDICAPPAPGRSFSEEAMIIPPMPSSNPR